MKLLNLLSQIVLKIKTQNREKIFLGISVNEKMKNKLENRGITVMLVGFVENHPKGCYRFYNFDRKSILMSRDVIWLNKYHHEHFCTKPEDQLILEVDAEFYAKYFWKNEKIFK